MRQRSLNIDVNDQNFINNGGRKGMDLITEYNQHVPMFFTREGAEVNLTGQYKGTSIFFICNGPSFVTLNKDLLSLPGVMTFGINNGPRTFRPDFWTSVDEPERFLKSIWLDPKIIKFVTMTQYDRVIFDNERWQMTNKKVGECPNVVGYRRNEKFNPARFLEETHLNWGCDKDNGGGRSVMLPALRIMYILGFRKVYLLGCDMKMSETYTYHFDEQRSKGAINGNNNTYDRLKEEYLSQLKPYFDKAGFQVFNCNPDSNLKVFPFIKFEDAIKEAISPLGDVANERVWGLYSNLEEKMQWKEEASVEQKPHLETLKLLEQGQSVYVPPRQPKLPKKPKNESTTPNIVKSVVAPSKNPAVVPLEQPTMPFKRPNMNIPCQPPKPRQYVQDTFNNQPNVPNVPVIPKPVNNTVVIEANKARARLEIEKEQNINSIRPVNVSVNNVPKPLSIPRPPRPFRPPVYITNISNESVSPNLNNIHYYDVNGNVIAPPNNLPDIPNQANNVNDTKKDNEA